MDYRERQEREIATIKGRTITVELSDADCKRLTAKCGKYGLTVGELIGNFIGDLVWGTYVNGGAESDAAQEWFRRCGFPMFAENTLLRHLICSECCYPEDYLDVWEDIEIAKRQKKHLEEHPEDADEESQYIDSDIEEWEKELEEMREGWEPEREPDMEKEIAAIKGWIEERKKLLGEEYTKWDIETWNMEAWDM